MAPASGRQHTLQHGPYRATIASVGASLRSLTHEGRDLVVPFDADEVRPAYRGAILAPWPNRVVNGQYTFGGTTHQLPLTEPDRGHALHGLAGWLDFHALAAESDRITLAALIEPQSGYPWRLHITTTYTLGSDGLTQTVHAENLSPTPAPFGTGPHPYLVAGPGLVDDWTLDLPAAAVLTVTPDRLAPTTLGPVDTTFDFRTPRQIGATAIDHAFTELARDAHGLTTVRVTDSKGSGVAITWDEQCPWVQIHTADLPDGIAQPGHRTGLAIEPMTCAPDAYNTQHYSFDTNLIILQPGQATEASWHITAI